MSERVKALLITKSESGLIPAWKEIAEEDLMEGDVTVRVTHSAINYKDGLILGGSPRFVRRTPMIPGIDLAGVVTQSSHAQFSSGDPVLANGYGLGEVHYGGYAGMARLSGDWLLHIPDGFDADAAMALGTAGYTSMLCVMALESHGVLPDMGPVLVTGAAGGVGSVAIALLARLGYDVVASTGRAEEADYLKSLGAGSVIERKELSEPGKPLAEERYAGVVDSVGSHTLANAIAQAKYGGTVAACGLAQGMDLPASVAPFILRGVTLAGIDSVMAPMEKRLEAWSRLAKLIDRAKLEEATTRRPLADVLELGPQILAGKVRGRIVLEVG